MSINGAGDKVSWGRQLKVYRRKGMSADFAAFPGAVPENGVRISEAEYNLPFLCGLRKFGVRLPFLFRKRISGCEFLR